jgi:hypothetical protein
MFYLLNVAEDTPDTIGLMDGARRFLATDGREASLEFLCSIANPYTEHFCRINGNGKECDEAKFTNALARPGTTTLSRYVSIGRSFLRIWRC